MGPVSGERVRDVLYAPVGFLLRWLVLEPVLGLGWLVGHWPRWVPDLARFTRGTDFRQLHCAWADWLDQNFGLIESGAPWLDRAGSWVFDRCHTSAPGTRGHPMEWVCIPRPPVQVHCEREVTAVYGFDGSVPDRLAGLAAALAAAGWQEHAHAVWAPLRELSRREGRGEPPEPPLEGLYWSPLPGSGLPPGLSPTGESYTVGGVEMGIGWSSWGQPAGLLRTRKFGQPGDHGRTANLELAKDLGWPGDLAAANVVYQPVEISEAGVDELARQAVARHFHVVAIRITAHYYPNPSTADDRLRKRLRPILPTRPQP